MYFKHIFLLTTMLLGATHARYTVVPKFYAQDSAIIVDTDQAPPPPIRKLKPPASMLSYYQPVQNLPAYKIIPRLRTANQTRTIPTTTTVAPNNTEIFTQEEFPRDLLEIAQQKLGLKSLEEVPSITELAELLGTNSAAETISYIKQLTNTEQGIALMKAYIESSDYTDNMGSNKNKQLEEDGASVEQSIKDATTPKPGFLKRITAFLSSYNMPYQQKELNEEAEPELKKVALTTPVPLRDLRPLYVRSPLPYHYPIPLRPGLALNRTYANAKILPNHPYMVVSSKKPIATLTAPHINTMKTLTPAYIQQLARIVNVSPEKLAQFLQSKPKLAELAAKMARFPLAHERNPLSDAQLLAAVQKAMEYDEDLKKLLNSTDTLK